MARRPLLMLLTLVLVGGSSLAMPASPATADCSGPTIRRIEPVVRGEVMTIEGYAFGDNCYDTGPPPEGEGTLGVPVADVELLIVQGDREVLIARGSANDEYEFSVDVMVPPRLEPGPAQLVARWGMTRSTVQTLEILPDTPVADPPGTTPDVTFGSVPESTATPSTTSGSEPGVESVAPVDEGSADDDADDSRPSVIAGVVGLLVVGVVGGVVLARGRSTTAT